MKNNEKIDINLSSGVSETDLSEEEVFNLNYETALRYINIAEHMKQFEDQDKYYHRAISYFKKINDDKRFSSKIRELNFKKFKVRTEGKVNLYEEASRIRDNAKSPQDYYSAQALFNRIYKYEEKHPIREKWVSPELYARAMECGDSGAQAELCEKLAHKKESEERRQSLFASILVVLVVAAVLVFSRTTAFHKTLATVYEMVGDHTDAYQQYKVVYDRTNDPAAYEKYLKSRYETAMKALKHGDKEIAYNNFAACVNDDYEDSRQQFFLLEQENVANCPLGEIVHFAHMDWRVLEKQDGRALLLKDNSIGSVTFNETAGPCTWETSSVRTWLNNDFLNENFTTYEIDSIIDTQVPASTNKDYPGVTAGNATTDKLYLLSAEDLETYNEWIHPTKSCWWLRTPGAHEGTMSFVYRDKSLMSYGYEATNGEMTIKPAMWINLK